MDNSRTLACCQLISEGDREEEVDSEPEAFDCQNCELISQLDLLDHLNWQAWRIYRKLSGGLVDKLGIGDRVFGAVLEDEGICTSAEMLELVDRLTVIHNVFDYVPSSGSDGSQGD